MVHGVFIRNFHVWQPFGLHLNRRFPSVGMQRTFQFREERRRFRTESELLAGSPLRAASLPQDH